MLSGAPMPRPRIDVCQAAQIITLRDSINGPGVEVFKGKRITRFYHGLEGMPGGMVDPGETVLEAAVREFGEEAGASIDPKKLIKISEFEEKSHRGQGMLEITTFVTNAVGLTLYNASPDEHEYMEWEAAAQSVKHHENNLRKMTPALAFYLQQCRQLLDTTTEQVIRALQNMPYDENLA